MSQNRLWTALFLAVQLSVVFCRTTADYHTQSEQKDVKHDVSLSYKAATPPDVMHSGTYYVRRVDLTPLWIVLIIVGCFTFLSLVTGCITYLCRRKGTIRRGYIINPNGRQWTGQVQQLQHASSQHSISAVGNTQQTLPQQQSVSQLPGQYTTASQQHLYPAVHQVQQYAPLTAESQRSPTTMQFQNPTCSPKAD